MTTTRPDAESAKMAVAPAVGVAVGPRDRPGDTKPKDRTLEDVLSSINSDPLASHRVVSPFFIFLSQKTATAALLIANNGCAAGLQLRRMALYVVFQLSKDVLSVWHPNF